LIYPLIIVVLAFGFLVFSCMTLTPILVRTYYDLVSRPDPVIAALDQINRVLPTWAPWMAVVLCVVLLALWYRSGRALHSTTNSARGVVGRWLSGGNRPRRWPSVRQAMQDGRLATFAELLKLMHDHQVPLPEAVVLAADASGDRALGQSARELARRLESGAVLSRRSDLPGDFPSLVGWSLVAGMGPTGMSRALAASANMYRRRAAQAAQWAFLYLPVLLTITIGGSAVLLYALVIVWPLTRLLFQLSLP
jgi:type II secretory pathway component PulF